MFDLKLNIVNFITLDLRMYAKNLKKEKMLGMQANKIA